jgi:hypothetical protein
MKISQQPYLSGLCGHYAIYNSCSLAGHSLDHSTLHAIHGRRWLAPFFGINDARMQKVLTDLSIQHRVFELSDFTTTRKLLTASLKAGCPVILSVENDSHWISVAGIDRDSFITVDSVGHPLVNKVSSTELMEWVDSNRYFFISVTPTRHGIVPLRTTSYQDIHRLLKRAAN